MVCHFFKISFAFIIEKENVWTFGVNFRSSHRPNNERNHLKLKKSWLKYKQNYAEPLIQPALLLLMLCSYGINEKLGILQILKCIQFWTKTENRQKWCKHNVSVHSVHTNYFTQRKKEGKKMKKNTQKSHIEKFVDTMHNGFHLAHHNSNYFISWFSVHQTTKHIHDTHFWR